MDELTLKTLGLDKEEVTERVVDRIVDRFMEKHGSENTFSDQVQAKVEQKFDVAIREVAGKHVLPEIETYIEHVSLQETNNWGEKIGKPKTFTEYLLARAESYLQEPVNYEGKSKSEIRDNFDHRHFRGDRSRIAHLIQKHLDETVKSAVATAINGVNGALMAGIGEAVRDNAKRAISKLKFEVKD